MHDTIRLFVGTSPGGEDYEAEAVLEWSARKHCSLPLEIVWMRQAKKGPYAGWNCSTGRTPFSHFRWSIPAMCDFSGRGIYCDVDFVFRGDLAELWREDIPAILVTKPGAADCILFDNAKCKGHIPSLEELKRLSDPNGHVTKYLKTHPELVTAYTSGNWNHKTGKNTTPDLGVFSPQTKAVHYTRIENQLHLKHALKRLGKKGHWYTGPTFAHPTPDLQTLFDDLLVEAQANGLTYESYQYGSDVKLVRSDFTYKNHRGLGA
jgi:hypothetical protein